MRKASFRGCNKFKSVKGERTARHAFHCSAAVRSSNSAIKAQQILAEKYSISSDVVERENSYTQTRGEAVPLRTMEPNCNPTETPSPQLPRRTLDGVEGPFISASDYVRALGEH